MSFGKIGFRLWKVSLPNIVLTLFCVDLWSHIDSIKSIELFFVFKIKVYFCQKKIDLKVYSCQKKIDFKMIFKMCFWPFIGRPTDRLTIDRAELLCRSTEWSTDIHKISLSALCTLWSTVRSFDCESFALSWARSTDSVDRQRALLSGWDKQSIDRSTAIPNGRKSDCWRSTRQKNFLLIFFLTASFLFVFFGSFPNDFWVFSLCFHPL